MCLAGAVRIGLWDELRPLDWGGAFRPVGMRLLASLLVLGTNLVSIGMVAGICERGRRGRPRKKK